MISRRIFRQARASGRRPARRGFTLIELLLVVAISALAVGVAVPAFVRSARGMKLRSSARTVVMAHRYARGLAVLQQARAAILFDEAANNVEIVTVGSAAGTSEKQAFLDGRTHRTGLERPAGEDAGSPPPAAVNTELIRSLSDGVRIAAFEGRTEGRGGQKVYWVNYYPNGMCDKFAITLADERDREVAIEIDPISGAVDVKYE